MATTELLFKAMADPTRQRILGVLSVEELSVTELVEVLDQPQSTISRHLKTLRDAGLLVERRNGPTVLHSTYPPAPDPVSLTSDKESAPHGKENGSGASVSALRNRLLAWIGQQPVGDEVRERLDRVVRSRRAEQADFFDAIGDRWDQLRVEAFGDAFHLEAMTWLVPEAWTVADIGTGTGYLLPMLSTRFAQVIAVDPASNMLEIARNRPGLENAANISFRTGSLESLPLESGSLDLAIASLVLHHVAEPAVAMAELRRCVREGGSLLLVEQEPHAHGDFHERMGDRWPGFDRSTLARWTQEAGFRQVRTHPLLTARPAVRRGMEAPRLFVLVAR